MKVEAKEVKITTCTFVAQIPRIKVMVARLHFKHHIAPLLLLGCLHIASPSVINGGLLVS